LPYSQVTVIYREIERTYQATSRHKTNQFQYVERDDMNIFASTTDFYNDEAGAVTVDWVVLTAAIVGLGLAVVASVRTGAISVASQIQSSLSSASIGPLGTMN
jgi:hypothetical protein